jgi:lipoate-protein ligase A
MTLAEGVQQTGAEHMALDDRLAAEGRPAVRWFTWSRPAMSLGFRQAAPGWTAGWAAAHGAPELVERPTGGGIAFHGTDLSVALVAPRAGIDPHAVLTQACEHAARLCRRYGIEPDVVVDAPGGSRVTYCLLEPSPYAVFIGSRKVAGFALRRYPESWLVQGSMLINPVTDALARWIPAEALEGLRRRAIPLSEAAGRALDPAALAAAMGSGW